MAHGSTRFNCILPRKSFFLYIASMTAKPVNLLTFLIVSCASSAPKSFLHARDNESHMLEEYGLMPTQTDKFSSDPTLNAVRFRPLGAATSEWIVKVLCKNLNTRTPTGGSMLPYRPSIPQVMPNSLTCLNSSKSCGTDTSIQ